MNTLEPSVYQLINIYKSQNKVIDEDIESLKNERDIIDNKIRQLNYDGQKNLEFIEKLEELQKYIDGKGIR